MDEELRTLHEAMVVKDRLRVLAELQASYWDELTSRGFDSSVAEQLVLDWSRHAYGMTFRAMPEPDVASELTELLGAPAEGAQPAGPAAEADADPSSVPPGEPWLQLVQDVEEQLEADAGERDDRAA